MFIWAIRKADVKPDQWFERISMTGPKPTPKFATDRMTTFFSEEEADDCVISLALAFDVKIEAKKFQLVE